MLIQRRNSLGLSLVMAFVFLLLSACVHDEEEKQSQTEKPTFSSFANSLFYSSEDSDPQEVNDLDLEFDAQEDPNAFDTLLGIMDESS